jgi:hypothetical protein
MRQAEQIGERVWECGEEVLSQLRLACERTFQSSTHLDCL